VRGSPGTSIPVVTLVVFRVGARELCLRVEHVVEILRMVAITPVPGAAPWIAGVINLRGRTVPVVDLRVRLGFPPAVPGLATPIVVALVGDRPVGVIVDQVAGVVRVPDDALEPPEGLSVSGSGVAGLAHVQGRLVIILDPAPLAEGSERLVLPEHALDPG
jgi:purine-binding chemotaxis protein CheW